MARVFNGQQVMADFEGNVVDAEHLFRARMDDPAVRAMIQTKASRAGETPEEYAVLTAPINHPIINAILEEGRNVLLDLMKQRGYTTEANIIQQTLSQYQGALSEQQIEQLFLDGLEKVDAGLHEYYKAALEIESQDRELGTYFTRQRALAAQGIRSVAQ